MCLVLQEAGLGRLMVLPLEGNVVVHAQYGLQYAKHVTKCMLTAL